jgi:hypothetical protein
VAVSFVIVRGCIGDFFTQNPTKIEAQTEDHSLCMAAGQSSYAECGEFVE